MIASQCQEKAHIRIQDHQLQDIKEIMSCCCVSTLTDCVKDNKRIYGDRHMDSKENEQVEIGSMRGFNKVKRLKFHGTILGKKMEVLVDSGATNNFIS